MADEETEELTTEQQAMMDLLKHLNGPQIFRKEWLITDADMRADTALIVNRYIAGNETVTVTTSVLNAYDAMRTTRRNRTRTVGTYELDSSGHDINIAAGAEIKETVYGGVMLTAALSSEAMIGGAYAHTIGAGAYLRLAAWTDFLAWGGWGEVDTARIEIALLMIRSMIGYVHAAGMRVGVASRYIDDFQNRTMAVAQATMTGATYDEIGDPAGGLTNEN